MLRVAVELPASFASAGEFLADAQAYEAAGADTIWVGAAGQEPLVLLAALAVVTSRARLGAPAPATPPWPAELHARVVAALQRLSRDRVVLGVPAEAAAAPPAEGASLLVCGGEPDEVARMRAGVPDGLEVWARVPAPGGRSEWRELHAAYAGTGVTGVIVPHAPNLLDILRNPEEDDRQDLSMAVG